MEKKKDILETANRFYNKSEAERIVSDINYVHESMEGLLNCKAEPEVLNGIKAKIATAVITDNYRKKRFKLVASIAAMIILVGAVTLQMQIGTALRNFDSRDTIASDFWNSDNSTDNFYQKIELFESDMQNNNGTYDKIDDSMLYLEQDLIDNQTDFWKG